MKLFMTLMLIAVCVSCASRPETKDAGVLWNEWTADNGETPDLAEDVIIPEADVCSECDNVQQDPGYSQDPDVIPDNYVPPDDAKPEADLVPDIDTALPPLACTSDVCHDTVSDLYWFKAANYKSDAAASTSFCSGVGEYGGHSGWRLPTLEELKTLRRGCTSDGGCGKKRDSTCYWDSGLAGSCDIPFWSETVNGTNNFSIDFKTGAVAAESATLDRYARCVTSQ